MYGHYCLAVCLMMTQLSIIVGETVHLPVRQHQTKKTAGFPSIPGNTVYLPNEPNIGGPHDTQTLGIFKPLGPSCFGSEEREDNEGDSVLMENNQGFYSLINDESGISPKLMGAFSMGLTLKHKSRFMSNGTTNLKGLIIYFFTYKNKSSLNPECYIGTEGQLKDEVIQSLNDLSKNEVSEPEFAHSWNKYQDFFHKYGSHLVTGIFYGATFKLWTFAKIEDGYTDKQVITRSCANFAGPLLFGDLNVDACKTLSKDDAEKSFAYNMETHFKTVGGSADTASKLTFNRSIELIEKFLKEGRERPVTVKNQYASICEILRDKYPEQRAVADIMCQYYEGFLDFGCSLMHNRSDTQNLQTYDDQFGYFKTRTFRRDPTQPNEQLFECVLAKQGCQDDADCHGNKDGTFCSGPTCVEHVPPPFGKKAMRAKIRRDKSGSSSEGINQSCYYDDKLGARCNSDWSKEEIIWDSVTKGREISVTGKSNKHDISSYYIVFMSVFVMKTNMY